MESFFFSHRDNGWRSPRCVLPAPLPRRSPSLYLLPFEQKHAAHPAQRDAPAKSSLPACSLLVSSATDSIPRACVNRGPSSHWRGRGERRDAQGKIKRDRQTPPLSCTRGETSRRCVPRTVKIFFFFFKNVCRKLCGVCVPLSCCSIISARATEKTLCVIVTMGRGKGGDRILFAPENERQWEGRYSHGQHPSPPSTILQRRHPAPSKTLAVGKASAESPKTPSCLAPCILVCMFSLRLTIIESSLTSGGGGGGPQYEAFFLSQTHTQQSHMSSV